MKLIYHIPLLLTALITLAACNGAATQSQNQGAQADTLQYATGLNITRHDHYTIVEVKNPWKDNALLQTYILVPRDSAIPDSLPAGTVLHVPLRNCLVYSSVHCNAINELTGSYSAVGGVCDAQYFATPAIIEGVKSGAIADCGNSMAPTIEKVMMLHPDAIVLSPFQNSGYGALAATGIPIVECADYMEPLPLGRAEWIKFYGMLFGNEQRGDSIFNAVRDSYLSLTEKVAHIEQRPKVLTETVMNGVWYVPGGNSYMSRLIADAGGYSPWQDTQSSGSIPLDFSKVYEQAHDADVWLIKSFAQNATLNDIKAIDTRNAQFKAFNNGGIYHCNTAQSTLFDDFPFHPDVLLAEYIEIFHPDSIEWETRYFKKIEK